jgi:hypothetical protein
MAVCSPTGKTLHGNFTIIPSANKWVFHAIYRLAFLSMYDKQICLLYQLVIMDEEDAEYCSFETLILTHEIEKIRPWIPAFLTYILRFCREGEVYKRYFWASASLETCAPGRSYFMNSVFLGVTLAWLMQSPESLFLTCNSFTSFSVLILLNHDE